MGVLFPCVGFHLEEVFVSVKYLGRLQYGSSSIIRISCFWKMAYNSLRRSRDIVEPLGFCPVLCQFFTQ